MSPENGAAKQKTFLSLRQYSRRLMRGLRVALKFSVPFGYEDEAGFHYGAMPVRIELKKR